MDELNALLGEDDGSKFEDKFNQMMKSPPGNHNKPSRSLMPSETKVTAAPS